VTRPFNPWTPSIEQQVLDRLAAGAEQLDLELSGAQRQQLLIYLKLMSRWNQAYNLTAIKQPMAMAERHLLDSLSIARWIEADELLDAGTGAGLPGIPLAIVFPDKHVRLVDSNGKKIRFVRAAIRELQLEQAEVIQSRLEDLAPDVDLQAVDITCRALASLTQLVEWSQAWLLRGSRLLAMKAELHDSELRAVPDDYNVQLEPLNSVSASGAAQPPRSVAIITCAAPDVANLGA